MKYKTAVFILRNYSEIIEDLAVKTVYRKVLPLCKKSTTKTNDHFGLDYFIRNLKDFELEKLTPRALAKMWDTMIQFEEDQHE